MMCCPECELFPAVSSGYLCMDCWLRIKANRELKEGKTYQAIQTRRKRDRWQEDIRTLSFLARDESDGATLIQ